MLTAHGLSKAYDIHPLFNNVSFSVNPGERVGLIGPNGSGKTTLLRLLTGEEQPDQGHIFMPTDLRLGYLPQGFEFEPEATLQSIVGHAAGEPEVLEAELTRLGLALVERPDEPALQIAYDQIVQQMNRFVPGQTERVLAVLGLDEVDRELPARLLSGGQKTRLGLALVLLAEPQLLLLDEPTNHLDIAMLEWLERWLAGFSGGILLVSHDRTFLDRTVTKVLALDPQSRTVREYAGNYSDYLEQSLLERDKQWAAYKDQTYEARRMRQDIARIKTQARGTETATKNDQLRRYAKKVARKAKSREKKLERYLDSDDRVDKPGRSWQVQLDLPAPDHLGSDVLMLEEVTIGYPGHEPLLSNLNLRIQAGQRVVLTGPNGSGKSTLLRTVAGHLAAMTGRVRLGASVHLGYMSQEQSLLDPQRSALEHLQDVASFTETGARTFLHFFLFNDDEPLRPSQVLSYGERARLALALLIAQGCNFLILDEPINHLDIPSRTAFEEALSQFEGTTLAVVHDRYFIERFATDVWMIKGTEISHQIQ